MSKYRNQNFQDYHTERTQRLRQGVFDHTWDLCAPAERVGSVQNGKQFEGGIF